MSLLVWKDFGDHCNEKNKIETPPNHFIWQQRNLFVSSPLSNILTFIQISFYLNLCYLVFLVWTFIIRLCLKAYVFLLNFSFACYWTIDKAKAWLGVRLLTMDCLLGKVPKSLTDRYVIPSCWEYLYWLPGIQFLFINYSFYRLIHNFMLEKLLTVWYRL